MTTTPRLVFTGTSDRSNENLHQDSPTKPEPYVVSEALKKAVNLAIYLKRPLLLEGDAGCGKTRLAYSVAYELGLPLYRWDVRSSTKAQDGLYEYDAILRLHDVKCRGGAVRHSPHLRKRRLKTIFPQSIATQGTQSITAHLGRWAKPFDCSIAPPLC